MLFVIKRLLQRKNQTIDLAKAGCVTMKQEAYYEDLITLNIRKRTEKRKTKNTATH